MTVLAVTVVAHRGEGITKKKNSGSYPAELFASLVYLAFAFHFVKHTINRVAYFSRKGVGVS